MSGSNPKLKGNRFKAHLRPAVANCTLAICFCLFGSLAFSKELGSELVTQRQLSGPIIAHSGQVISGKHISNPNGPCIIVDNAQKVLITQNEIGPCGSNPRYEVGIGVNHASDIQIIGNNFHEVSSALYATDSTSGKLLFEANRATQIRGPAPRGQLVQLNQYSGPQIMIRCNISDQAIGGYINRDGKGGPEDHINIFKSSGTTDSPIQIMHNKLRGGGSRSGGGILAVDGGEGAHVLIEGNVLVDAGQYGIGIPSGEDVVIRHNQIYASQHTWTNVGIYVWNQYAGTRCSNAEVSDNEVNYISQKGQSNPYWDSGNCGKVKTEKPNQLSDLFVRASIWNEPIAACQRSLKAW